MKKTRRTEEQIAFALKQAETGTSVAEVIRRMGISEQTLYRWKKVYGGLGVGELRRLKLSRRRTASSSSNESRPHTSLGWLTPVEYAAAAAKIVAE
jgi:transposase-like protein